MSSYLLIPFTYLKFWFIEAPRDILLYLFSLNNAFLEQLSTPLLIKTFFKPIKNEYREGLIWFSIAMGMVVKLPIILIGIVLFLLLLTFEIFFVLAFIFWPLATILLLFT